MDSRDTIFSLCEGGAGMRVKGSRSGDVVRDLHKISYELYDFQRAIRVFLNNPSEETERAVLQITDQIPQLLGDYKKAYTQLPSCPEDSVRP